MIEQIRAKISENAFEFTRHATDQSILRKITISEVREAIQNAQIIEDYPDDKYGPSCLILGYTLKKRPLHIQCSYPSRPVLKVITLYQPDPALWVDNKVRRE
jgi:hypothetical protein